MLKVIVLLMLFGSSLQQGPSFTCKNEFASIFSHSGMKQTCTFENIKSYSDIINVDKGTAYNYGSISSLKFIKSSLSTLPDSMFHLYTSVRNLQASNIMISSISQSAFNVPKSWDVINLSNNNIKTLVSRVFASMIIKSLDLSYNVIETIDNDAFNSADIDNVDLSFNKIKSIEYINTIKHFIAMQLNNNQIENVEKIGERLKAANWENTFTYLGTSKYPSFNFAENKIKTFSCSSNIKLLSVNLEKNNQLTDVALNKCVLDELDISDCVNLKKVALNDNLLSFTSMNNTLSDVDLTVATQLTSLAVANSSVDSDMIDRIMKLENLTLLDLSYNNIGPLNVSTFAKLKSLKALKLKATNISNIQFGTFSHQTKLGHFDISDNHLGTFDMQMIFSMSSLLILNLAKNDLTELGNFETSHLTLALLQAIDISANQFTCAYLHKFLRVLTVFKITLIRSELEEGETNIHGVKCIDDNGASIQIDPIMPDNVNTTDLKAKLNEIIAKFSLLQTDVNSKQNLMESKLNGYLNSMSNVAAQKYESNIASVEVKNSSMLEFALFIVCVCFSVFMLMQMFTYIKTHFLGRPRPSRGMSANTLNTNFEDY